MNEFLWLWVNYLICNFLFICLILDMYCIWKEKGGGGIKIRILKKIVKLNDKLCFVYGINMYMLLNNFNL